MTVETQIEHMKKELTRTNRQRIRNVLANIEDDLSLSALGYQVKTSKSLVIDNDIEEVATWHYVFESNMYIIDIEIKDFSPLLESRGHEYNARYEISMTDGFKSIEEKDFTAVYFDEYYSVIDFVKTNVIKRFRFVHRDKC